MEIREAVHRDDALLRQLLELWERSVRATHTFLSLAEIAAIRNDVPQALESVPHLLVAWEAGSPAGFLGADGERLEMLFLDPDHRGRGLGGALARYGLRTFGLTEVTVNEQNPQAMGFYEHLGFRVYGRSPVDEQGRPYPLLYMRLGSP